MPRLAMAMAMTVMAACWSGAAASKEFRAADTHPDGYPTVQAVVHMGQLIAERSGGRHRIKVFHSRQLGEEEETIEQTRVGAIDLTRVNLAPFNNVVPESMVPSLPFLFRSVDHLHAVLDGPIGEEILAAFEKHGFIGLTFYDSGARSLYNTRRPIRTVEDLKGLRIRVLQSDLFVAMIEALGAQAIPLPYGEVLTALSTGIIDGAENNWPSYEESRHFTVARHYALTEHVMVPEVLVMSKTVWDGLSAEDQTLFRQAAHDSVVPMRRLWREREARAETAVRAGGAAVVADIDKRPFAAAMAPVHERFMAEPRLRDLVRRIQQTP